MFNSCCSSKGAVVDVGGGSRWGLSVVWVYGWKFACKSWECKCECCVGVFAWTSWERECVWCVSVWVNVFAWMSWEHECKCCVGVEVYSFCMNELGACTCMWLWCGWKFRMNELWAWMRVLCRCMGVYKSACKSWEQQGFFLLNIIGAMQFVLYFLSTLCNIICYWKFDWMDHSRSWRWSAACWSTCCAAVVCALCSDGVCIGQASLWLI